MVYLTVSWWKGEKEADHVREIGSINASIHFCVVATGGILTGSIKNSDRLNSGVSRWRVGERGAVIQKGHGAIAAQVALLCKLPAFSLRER